MAINVLIVDNEPVEVDTVRELVNGTSFLQLKQTFTDPRQALRRENLEDIDLIFLDVQMPQLNGYSFIELLRGRAKIILMTSHEEYAIRGYEYDEVVDFLLKPIQNDRFFKAAYKAQRLIEDERESVQEPAPSAFPHPPASLFIKIKKEDWIIYQQVYLDTIMYIKAGGHTLSIYLEDGSQLMPVGATSLGTFLTHKLPDHLFIRVRRDCVISRKYIDCIRGNDIILLNKKEINIGETYRDDVRAFLEREAP